MTVDMNPAAQPRWLFPDWGRIPADLRALPQWVLWRAETDGANRWTKIPYRPDGRRASVTQPGDWSTFDAAWSAWCAGGFTGVGFVLTDGDPFCGIDLDGCISEGRLQPWAERILHEIGGYAEVTPSGTGIHIFVRATLPPGGRKKGRIELYDRSRFLTVTGVPLPREEGASDG